MSCLESLPGLRRQRHRKFHDRPLCGRRHPPYRLAHRHSTTPLRTTPSPCPTFMRPSSAPHGSRTTAGPPASLTARGRLYHAASRRGKTEKTSSGKTTSRQTVTARISPSGRKSWSLIALPAWEGHSPSDKPNHQRTAPATPPHPVGAPSIPAIMHGAPQAPRPSAPRPAIQTKRGLFTRP
jgi:hypothetical protein